MAASFEHQALLFWTDVKEFCFTLNEHYSLTLNHTQIMVLPSIVNVTAVMLVLRVCMHRHSHDHVCLRDSVPV